jgi:hypothetical protein
MRLSPLALLVSAVFYLLLAMAVSSRSGWAHAAEAAATVLMLLSLAGFMRDGHRPM